MNLVRKAADCQQCSGSGWIPIEGTLRVSACSCQEGQRRQQRVISAGIPRRYIHCSFSSFYDHKVQKYPELSAAKRRVQEMADLWTGRPGDKGLLLMGSCGSGKTHLAVALLQEIIATGKPGKLMFANFGDLIQEIHASYESDESPGKSQILRPILDADLLVLDELGSQKSTPFVQDVLYYVINSRYNDERTTVFTTNYVDQPREREESLEERIGKRLRSRLYEMCEDLNMRGDDYRRQERGATIR